MLKSIKNREEFQVAKSHVIVMFHDSSVIWGRFGFLLIVCRAAVSLSSTLKVRAKSAPVYATPSPHLTEVFKANECAGKALSELLSHLEKVSMETRLASYALPAFERAPNSGRKFVAGHQRTQKSEQRCCAAA